MKKQKCAICDALKKDEFKIDINKKYYPICEVHSLQIFGKAS